MNDHKPVLGHLAGFITVLIWGTTFISTKVLLRVFTPVEILLIRFVIGYLALCLVFPHRLRLRDRRQNWYFAGAGLCGITLYYLFENIALTYTLASNVGVIISVAPFFTAVFGRVFLKEGRMDGRFLMGFCIAMGGVSLISFSSGSAFHLNPLGDLLAVLAAIIWAAYSTLVKKISGFGYHTIQATRRTFFFGLLFMVPVLAFGQVPISFEPLFDMTVILNLLFLGLGASALCFVTWNFAVKVLGSVKTSVYIYMVPVITTVTSALILKEPVTWMTVFGIVLTLTGLFLSENR